jgi:hypothetical protein
VWATVVSVEDPATNQVRMLTDFGELVLTWSDFDPLPTPGEQMDVEVSLAGEKTVWDRDVTVVGSEAKRGIEQVADGFLLTGLGEWDQESRILYVSVDAWCLVSMPLANDLGESRELGAVRVHARTLVVFDINT